MSRGWWESATGLGLAQGDLFEHRVFPEVLSGNAGEVGDRGESILKRGSLLVVTQSCEFENGRNPEMVVLCRSYLLREYEQALGRVMGKDVLESIRQGRREGLHMLAAPGGNGESNGILIADFRQVVVLPSTLPIEWVKGTNPRWRLVSPYVEHFSQSFARFFMRVGLPIPIPSFK